MKISLLCDSSQVLGGGWTFQRNLAKGLNLLGHEVINDYTKADIALVSGVTMVTRETINAVQEAKVKLVVRLDNVPRNSRNRNTGTSRLKEFTTKADEIVWQCQWVKDYLNDFIGREGKIIYNGVDTDIFKPDGDKYDFGDKDNVYLYSRFNRDENKRYEEVWYNFQLLFRENKNRKLVLVGQFSSEQIEYSFDFFRGEKVDYLGIVMEPERMAKIYRSCGYMFAPYFIDCFSNTYLEGIVTGIKLCDINMSGGTPEMLELFNKYGRDYFTLERMAKDYERLFEEVLEKSKKI